MKKVEMKVLRGLVGTIYIKGVRNELGVVCDVAERWIRKTRLTQLGSVGCINVVGCICY